MKKIEKMTPDELKNLVSYTKGDSVIYYSNIDSLQKTQIVYQGTPYELDAADMVTITEGKLNYEAYMLSMTQSHAEIIMKEQAEAVLVDHFSNQIDEVTTQFKENFDKLHSTFSSAASTLKSSTKIADEVTKLSGKLTEAANDFEVSTLQKKLEDKLDELKPVKQEFDEVVGKLKKLFK